jgi:class 3 adenylate cyclase
MVLGTSHPLLGSPAARPVVRLSPQAGIVFLVLALTLNSLLAVFGSLLWGFFPYWPAFMVCALMSVYFGWWGVLVAALCPIPSSFLLVSDSPFYLYVPVSILQATLVMVAFRVFQIDPALRTWLDRVKYLVLAIAIPSLLGGSLAWMLRSLYPVNDGPLPSYAATWMLENLLPAVFPGIWLHRVVGEATTPFSWDHDRRPTSWQRRVAEYATPWMISLTLLGSLLVMMVILHIGWDHVRDAGGTMIPGLWHRIETDIVAPLPGLRPTVLLLSISLLISLGSSIQLAKRMWVVTEAIRRHLPSARVSEWVVSGIDPPSERRVTTVAFIRIRNFGEVSSRLAPGEVVAWLNGFLTRVDDVCARRGGSVISFTGERLLLVFGLHTDGDGAADAVDCMIEAVQELRSVAGGPDGATQSGYQPEIAIHTGPITAGVIGSVDRRHFSIVGATVDTTARLLSVTRSLPAELLPMVLSRDTMKESSLLHVPSLEQDFVEFSSAVEQDAVPCSLWALRAEAQQGVRAALALHLSRGRG